MPTLTFTRTIDPDTFSLSCTLSDSDLSAAFDRVEPDEELFYALFSNSFNDKPASEKLRLLAQVVELTEQAAQLNAELLAIEPKE